MDLLGFEEVEEVVADSLDRLHRDGPEEEFKSFGVDYDDLADKVVDIFGEKAPEWFAGFHSGLCLAMRYWEYRMPGGQDGD